MDDFAEIDTTIPLTAPYIVYLAKVGRLVFHWNQLESVMREIAATLTAPHDYIARRNSKTFFVEAGNVPLCNAVRALNENRQSLASYPLIEHAVQAFDRLREHRNYIIHGVYGIGNARLEPLTDENRDRPLSEAFILTEKPNAHVIQHSAKGKNAFVLDFISEETIDDIDAGIRELRTFVREVEIWIRWETEQWERVDPLAPPDIPQLPKRLKKQPYGRRAFAQPDG